MSTKFNGTIVETSGIRTISGGGTNASTASGALANLGGYPVSNPSGFITGYDTGLFYASSNPSGYITGINDLVYTTGDQVISGLKTFSQGIYIDGNSSVSALFVSGQRVGVNNENPQASLDVSGSTMFSERPTVNGTGVLLEGEIQSNTIISGVIYSAQVNVKNGQGSTIYKGQPVYIKGANGSNIIVGLASNTGEATSSKTLGLVVQDSLAQNALGTVITDGLLQGFDASTANAGDPIWLGPTGSLIYGSANKPYAPDHLVYLGVVTRAQNNGELFVKVQNGYELDELHDVNVTGVSSGQFLFRNNNLWSGKSLSVSDVSNLQSSLDSKQVTGDYYASNNPSGFITGVFQPNPDYVSIPDLLAKANSTQGGPFDRLSSTLYSDGAFPGDDVSYGLAYGSTYGGEASKWNLIYRNSDSVYSLSSTALVTGGEYPWSVSYNNGVVVTKEAAARLISELSGSASEGSSIYAARADHIHIFPTASEIGAYPTSNPSGFISGVSQFNYISGDLSGSLLSPALSHIQGNAISAASPSAGQTLQWNGTAWVPGSIPNGGNGGGGIPYYFNFANTSGIAPVSGLPTSPVAPSQLGRNYSVGSGSITSTDLTQGLYSLICGFVTPAADPGVTDIPAGLWDFNIWCDILGGTLNSNQTQFQIKVYKYDSTTQVYTSIANSDAVFVYDPITIAQYIGNVTMPQTTILATDRIYVELWAQKNVNQPRQIRFYFDSLHPSHVHTTLPSVAGNGIVKVVNGVMQSPASKIIDDDIDVSAGIQQSKIQNLTGDLAGLYPRSNPSGFVSSNISGISGAIQLTNMVQITQSGYNTIASPSASTLYIIVG